MVQTKKLFLLINLVPRLPSFYTRTKFRLKNCVFTVHLLQRKINFFNHVWFEGEIYCKLKNIHLGKPPLISKHFFNSFTLLYIRLHSSTFVQTRLVTHLHSSTLVYIRLVTCLFFKNRSKTPKACNFIKKENLTRVLSCDFKKTFKNTLFYITPLMFYKYTVNTRFWSVQYTRFTQGLRQLLFTVFG